MDDELLRLQAWFIQQTNGDWEHSNGIQISTLDNPGWSVKIDITDTGLSGKSFKALNQHFTEVDWMVCRVQDNRFEGFGGPLSLRRILTTFLDWALDC